MAKVDKILAELGRKCSPVATLRNVDNPLVKREYIEEAKQALYKDMLELIGEDEPVYSNLDGDAGYWEKQGSNQQKAELRTKLKDYFGID